MPPWTKKKLIEFLRQHPSELILIEAHGSQIKLKGRVEEVTDLDLCGSWLQEASLRFETEGVQVTLTFHDDFLGVLCSVQPSEDSESEVFIPGEIAYDALRLTLLW